MNRIAEFEKVSFKRFLEDAKTCYESKDESTIKDIYDNIKLPVRKTKGAAGFDFLLPVKTIINPGQSITIPTGVKAKIEDGWFLSLYPRSSLGFKYKLMLDNTVGIIDSDYYSSKREGHILAKMTNHSNSTVVIESGEGFMQGIFLQFGITYGDNATEERQGGFGSTNK